MEIGQQGADGVSQLLSQPICDGHPTGDNGPEGVLVLCILSKP